MQGRVAKTTNIIYSAQNPRRYYSVSYGFQQSLALRFTTLTKGFFLLDGKNASVTQSPHLKFPDNLKGHMIYTPFYVNVNDCMLWEQAVRLLNVDANPLIPISTYPVKK